jgi:hypothetical protein
MAARELLSKSLDGIPFTRRVTHHLKYIAPAEIRKPRHDVTILPNIKIWLREDSDGVLGDFVCVVWGAETNPPRIDEMVTSHAREA